MAVPFPRCCSFGFGVVTGVVLKALLNLANFPQNHLQHSPFKEITTFSARTPEIIFNSSSCRSCYKKNTEKFSTSITSVRENLGTSREPELSRKRCHFHWWMMRLRMIMIIWCVLDVSDCYKLIVCFSCFFHVKNKSSTNCGTCSEFRTEKSPRKPSKTQAV